MVAAVAVKLVDKISAWAFGPDPALSDAQIKDGADYYAKAVALLFPLADYGRWLVIAAPVVWTLGVVGARVAEAKKRSNARKAAIGTTIPSGPPPTPGTTNAGPGPRAAAGA
jgi:hypothetical protein